MGDTRSVQVKLLLMIFLTACGQFSETFAAPLTANPDASAPTTDASLTHDAEALPLADKGAGEMNDGASPDAVEDAGREAGEPPALLTDGKACTASSACAGGCCEWDDFRDAATAACAEVNTDPLSDQRCLCKSPAECTPVPSLACDAGHVAPTCAIDFTAGTFGRPTECLRKCPQ